MPKFEITTLKREELDILLEMIKEFGAIRRDGRFFTMFKRKT